MDHADIHRIQELAQKLTMRNPGLPTLPPDLGFPPFIYDIDRCLTSAYVDGKQLLLPELRESRTLAVYSDYGGEHKESKFLTYTFLFQEYDSCLHFSEEQKKVRLKYGLVKPYKEIAFKDRKYGPLEAALPEFLKLANNFLNGLLVTLVIDKRVLSTVGFDRPDILNEVTMILEREKLNIWNKKVLAKLVHIVHTIAYFSKLLGRNGQKFFWMTDDDAIVGNKGQQDGTTVLLHTLLDTYCGENFFERIMYATPFKEPYDMEGDLPDFGSILSLTDLVSGAVADYFQHTIDPGKPQVSTKSSDQIVAFTGQAGLSLKKVVLKYDYTDTNNYVVSLLGFRMLDGSSGDGLIVPVND